MASETIVPKMIVPYEWMLENVGEEPMTIASKMISFRDQRVFRVGLKNPIAQSSVLFLVAIDLNKMGMEVEDIKFRIQVSGLDPAKMMEMTREDIGNEGSLQLFTATLNEKVVGNCKIMFRICIGGTDPGYSFQLCDRTTPTFRCTSTFQISRDGNEQPKVVMQYQNENICVAYNIGKTEFPIPGGCAYISKPEIHLSCAKQLRFGLKVEDVYCRDAGVNSWLKMESKYFQRNLELLLDFSAKSLGTISDLQSVPFDVKFISTIGNYYYEMMDEGWTKDFWVAATNKKFTDVKIYVGSVEVMEVHRVILCARSPVLNLSVNKISNTGNKSIVTFGAEFDVDTVKHFLNFLYTGSLKTTDNVLQLIILATMYEVWTLQKYVGQQLINANLPDVEEVTGYLMQL